MAGLVATLLTLALASALVHAESGISYQQPPKSILDVLDAKPNPAAVISPDGNTLAQIEARRYPSIEELARPWLRMAGDRIDPLSNGPYRVAHIQSLSLRPLLDGNATARKVTLPAGGSFHSMRWSPDGKRFLLKRRTEQGTELWQGDVATAAVKPVAGVSLRAWMATDVVWLSSDELLAITVPDKRGPAPLPPKAPAGPVVQESFGKASAERTYQDLLKTPHDEALFAHYAMGQVTRVNLKTGARKNIGAPALIADIDATGDGKAMLVQRLVKPFGFTLPWSEFGRAVELIGMDGKLLAKVADVPRRENVPIQGVIKGPRNFYSSPLDGAVYLLEALDDGDPKKKVPHRDRLLRLDPPYSAEAREVYRAAQRINRITFLEEKDRALIVDFDRDRVWTTGRIVNLAGQQGEAPALFDLSARDRYNNPGNPVMKPLPNGGSVVRVVDGTVLTIGPGASPKGDRPFLDRISLADKSKTRLFQAGEAEYEMPIRVLDDKGERVVTSRESKTDVPNLFLRAGKAELVMLTRYVDTAPQLRQLKRELVKFKRADGVELSFWMVLPPDYKPGEKRPTLVWAYPLEFTDASTAGQVTGSPNRFTQIGGISHLFMALEGYVVLDDATMPVVGAPDVVNNTFIEQITANAEAIIAKAEELGITDRSKVAVGGHSYGAFMTAHLLAHTDLFKTGIARSGAYNRTLTPFGFQSERRSLWEAPETYIKLSPFMVANKLKEPILMMHGEVDNNSGTFPMQSERMFQALAGTGGNVRYVVLPHESHGYASRESVGHTLWEMSSWLKQQLGDPRAAK
ncbi:MAG: prolyl oligopeptidase family serine peptidase [Acidimicrobiia bacterium]